MTVNCSSAIAAGFVALLTLFGGTATVDCADTDQALAYWRPIRSSATTTELPANALALQLVPCLGSPNSELRDRIGYEFLTYWLRGKELTDTTRHELLRQLSARIDVQPESTLSDAAFSRSFSALILAELMRSDAEQAFMSAVERDELFRLAVQALARENDYRGLEPDVGWVHPVAHQADLLWRFALHPETSAIQAQAILESIRNKAATTSASYRFNEGDRLARSVSTVVSRELVDTDSFQQWLSTFEKPRSMNDWEDAYQSLHGMAELHNSKQFLRALRDQLADAEIDESIQDALNSLLQQFSQLV